MHFLQDQKYHKDVLFCIMYSGTVGLYGRCSTSNVHFKNIEVLLKRTALLIYLFIYFFHALLILLALRRFYN